jgi:hypothetical protein
VHFKPKAAILGLLVLDFAAKISFMDRPKSQNIVSLIVIMLGIAVALGISVFVGQYYPAIQFHVFGVLGALVTFTAYKLLPTPEFKCPACKGTGFSAVNQPAESPLRCARCDGKGWVTADKLSRPGEET